MAGNGGMQHGRDCPTMAAPCARTMGGNTTIINGDEAPTLDASVESTPFRASDLREDDSHVMGVYKAQAEPFAGS
jgi:hypothetical protein